MASSIELMENSQSHQIYDIICFESSVMTTVTRTPSRVSEWISDMESIYGAGPFGQDDLLIVGLDVEWRPTFGPGENPVATLQICINERCLIFQIIHAGSIPYKLASFLSDNRYTFVGVGVKQDLEKLQRDYGFGLNANAVDLGSVAAERYGRREMKGKGLKELCAVVLGKQIEKPFRVTTSPWDNVRLTMEQVKYACLDAVVSYEIGVALRADVA